MKALILAGGSGTRLWPLSRKNYPKQFLKLSDRMSFLQETAARLLQVVSADEIIVMTNNEYKFHVLSDIDALTGAKGGGVMKNLLLEPVGRNTAPAIALGMKYCTERLGCSDDEILFVSPSDHIIRPAEKFSACIRRAEEAAAKGYIVTFGVKPSRPETGYGYIKARSMRSGVSSGAYFEVERFTEKPDAVTAVRYVSEGNYYWNSGMFAFSIGTMMRELEAHVPDIGKLMQLNYDALLSRFDQMPDVSIDYAVAEKSDRMAVMPLDLYWNDIGSWDSLYDELDKDEKGNVRIGDVITVDTKDVLVIGSRRLVSTIGLEDCLVIDTDDALLIAKRGETQRVKEIVDALKRAGRKEAVEHLTTYRPWGSYTVLEEGERYKIKRIVVNPSAKLSLQKHYHRSEHWVVIKGTAKVTMGEREFFVHENESAFVPKSTLHKLENPGKVLLEIIEIQSGEYVGEDDIVRIDDLYGRHRE